MLSQREAYIGGFEQGISISLLIADGLELRRCQLKLLEGGLPVISLVRVMSQAPIRAEAHSPLGVVVGVTAVDRPDRDSKSARRGNRLVRGDLQ